MNLRALAPVLNNLNQLFDFVFLSLFILGILYLNFRSLISSAKDEAKKEAKRINQERKDKAADAGDNAKYVEVTTRSLNVIIVGTARAIYLGLLFAAVQVILLLIFWETSDVHFLNSDRILFTQETLRWAEIILFLSVLVYFYTRKKGERRGLYSIWGHLAVLLIGWYLGRWFGIIFVSVPLLAIYYYSIYRHADVIIPASDPDDPKEKFERFKILAWYTWGMQFPIIAVADPTGMKVETRIDGDSFQDYMGQPGYIWTHMPQAVGITNGTSFSRVDGPGAIYTKAYERPLDVIDLRTQLRTSEVEAITQDGIPIKAIVFMSFGVDRDPWERSLYNRLKFANPMLQSGMVPDHGNSHFQYSRARVRAVLGMEGVRTNISGQTASLSLRWDEQVIHLVEEAARRVISEIPLSELWLPNSAQDAKGVSALDLIADRIKDERNPDGLFSTLQRNGVRLYAARVVNYFSLKDKPDDRVDEFTRQQIPAWRAHWEQQVARRLVEADAEAEQRELDANALARSMLLTAVAQSLQRASENNRELPRYLIAMRFLGALDEMIRQEPEFATAEKGKALRERIAFLEGNLPPTEKG